MQATRRARLSATIQQHLSVLIARELKDPRIPALTVTAVELTPEAEQATVFVTILGGGSGDPREMKEALAGLASAAGFLRKSLAPILTVRHIPSLVFKEDKGLENTSRVHELLKKISDGA